MVQYWDYGSSSTSSGDFYNPTVFSQTATTMGTPTGSQYYYYPSNATGTSTTLYYSYVVQRFLVDVPEHWGEPEIAGFTRLINDETKTGFKVEMVINGQVKITDPDVQHRDMGAFALLIKKYANAEDRATIDKFFVQVPIIAPPKSA